MEGHHAGGGSQCAVAAFELVDQILQCGDGGVAVARVGRSLLFAPEDAVQLRHGFVDVTRRGVDRRGDRNVVARFLPVTSVNRLTFEFHDWRFQRAPSLVSSRITPKAASSVRILSARAKSRAFLAALRSETSASISWSAGPPSFAVGASTSKIESNRFRNSRAPGTLPAAKTPPSMAVLWSRTYFNSTASPLSGLLAASRS